MAGVLGGGMVVLVGSRWLRGAFGVVAVEGRSMAPTLHPGDWVVVESLSYRRRLPRRGEIVLAPDPRSSGRELVKRAVSVSGGRLEVRGDAENASTDSRTFGPLPTGDVRWRAVLRYWPMARLGVIR